MNEYFKFRNKLKHLRGNFFIKIGAIDFILITMNYVYYHTEQLNQKKSYVLHSYSLASKYSKWTFVQFCMQVEFKQPLEYIFMFSCSLQGFHIVDPN